MTGEPSIALDRLFRHGSARMLATLVRILGTDRIALAEESVQDALVRAMELWPYHGVPRNPTAWLIQVARNRALDEIRREKTFASKQSEIAGLLDALQSWTEPSLNSVEDDQLRLLFLCCHPAIPRDARVALALRMAGGLGIDEIARAFLAEPATIAQRLVRAKRVIRDQRIPIAIPSPAELRERLEPVLEAIYLIFTEGSSASAGEDAFRLDLVAEALRLARMLTADPRFASPAAHAALALMLFHSARIPARVSAAGDLLTLEEQERTNWDAALIAEGVAHFDASVSGDEITPYHIEAAIALCHSVAPSYDATDWERISELYDDLFQVTASPVVALNRAVAIGMARGPAAGLRELDRMGADPRLQKMAELPASRGELLMRSGHLPEAAAEFRASLALPMNEAERRMLQRKLGRCEMDHGDRRSIVQPSPSLR